MVGFAEDCITRGQRHGVAQSVSHLESSHTSSAPVADRGKSEDQDQR